MKICFLCGVNPAEHNATLGYIPCPSCRKSAPKVKPVEMVPDIVKEERKEYAKDLLQPFRGGEVSKEYIRAFGTQGAKISPTEASKAKNVWDGDVGYYRSED